MGRLHRKTSGWSDANTGGAFSTGRRDVSKAECTLRETSRRPVMYTARKQRPSPRRLVRCRLDISTAAEEAKKEAERKAAEEAKAAKEAKAAEAERIETERIEAVAEAKRIEAKRIEAMKNLKSLSTPPSNWVSEEAAAAMGEAMKKKFWNTK